MKPIRIMIKISGAITLILLIVIVCYSIIYDQILVSIMIGTYFTVIGVLGGLVFTKINQHFDDKRQRALSIKDDKRQRALLSEFDRLRESQLDVESTVKSINSRLEIIDTRLEAIESKLESTDNDIEDEPNDSNHTTHEDS